MNIMVMEGFHSGREPDNYCASRYPGTWWQKAFRSTVLCSNSVMIFILFYFICLFSIINNLEHVFVDQMAIYKMVTKHGDLCCNLWFTYLPHNSVTVHVVF